MLEQSLHDLVVVFAVLGGLALILRLLRSGLRFALRVAEVAAASGLAEVSARRGDLTGMAERRVELQRALLQRRRDLALTLLWSLWLGAPLFTSWVAEAYALAAPLWLLRGRPRGPLRRR